MEIFRLEIVNSCVPQTPKRPVVKSRAKDYVSIYTITMIVFFLIDLIWIGVVAKDLYARAIGHLLRDTVNWPAALIFYLICIGGIFLLVLTPAIRSGSRTSHVTIREACWA